MDYITKIETILICNNFRPNGIFVRAFLSDPLLFLQVFRVVKLWVAKTNEQKLS